MTIQRYEISVANREPRKIYILAETTTSDGKYVLYSDHIKALDEQKERADDHFASVLADVVEKHKAEVKRKAREAVEKAFDEVLIGGCIPGNKTNNCTFCDGWNAACDLQEKNMNEYKAKVLKEME